jgi:hypothetical protein
MLSPGCEYAAILPQYCRNDVRGAPRTELMGRCSFAARVVPAATPTRPQVGGRLTGSVRRLDRVENPG